MFLKFVIIISIAIKAKGNCINTKNKATKQSKHYCFWLAASLVNSLLAMTRHPITQT